jgi:hypothetical protein
MISPGKSKFKQGSQPRQQDPPNVENDSKITCSSTSSPIPPTKIVFLVLPPSSMFVARAMNDNVRVSESRVVNGPGPMRACSNNPHRRPPSSLIRVDGLSAVCQGHGRLATLTYRRAASTKYGTRVTLIFLRHSNTSIAYVNLVCTLVQDANWKISCYPPCRLFSRMSQAHLDLSRKTLRNLLPHDSLSVTLLPFYSRDVTFS